MFEDFIKLDEVAIKAILSKHTVSYSGDEITEIVYSSNVGMTTNRKGYFVLTDSYQLSYKIENGWLYIMEANTSKYCQIYKLELSDNILTKMFKQLDSMGVVLLHSGNDTLSRIDFIIHLRNTTVTSCNITKNTLVLKYKRNGNFHIESWDLFRYAI